MNLILALQQSGRLALTLWTLVAMIGSGCGDTDDGGTHGRDLGQVKVVAEYTSINSWTTSINRSVAEVIGELEELNTDFIFLGFRYQYAVPESPEEPPGFFTLDELDLAMQNGYTFSQLKDAISELHRKMPAVIFTAGLGIEFFYARDRDPITGVAIDNEKAWSLALDPAEYGLPLSKEAFQCEYGKRKGTFPDASDCSKFDPTKVDVFWPDLNKAAVHDLFLNKARKLIECGADSIWIDMLFTQCEHLLKLTSDINHPAIQQSFESGRRLVDDIRALTNPNGRPTFVGSWIIVLLEDQKVSAPPYPAPNYDYTVLTPSGQEVSDLKFNEGLWLEALSVTRGYLGQNIPIIARIDVGFKDSPAHVFSQHLSRDRQLDFLKTMDKFLADNRVLFSFPVSGLFMGPWDLGEKKTFAFDSHPVYDSLAPEFQSFDTLKELAAGRKTNPR